MVHADFQAQQKQDTTLGLVMVVVVETLVGADETGARSLVVTMTMPQTLHLRPPTATLVVVRMPVARERTQPLNVTANSRLNMPVDKQMSATHFAR